MGAVSTKGRLPDEPWAVALPWLLLVAAHEQGGHVLGAGSGTGVPFGSGHDGPLDQDVDGPGEVVRVVEAGGFCEVGDLLPSLLQVLDARFPEGVVGAHF